MKFLTALCRYIDKNCFVSLIAGVISVGAFAPFNYSLLAIFTVAIFMHLVIQAKCAKNAAIIGLFFGVGMFGIGVSWVYVSLHTFGNMVPILASIMVVLFVLVLSCFPSMLAFLYKKLFNKSSIFMAAVIILPSLWVLFEWLRGVVFSGFPWLYIGYAHTNSFMSSSAPVVGVLGVSYISLAISGLLVWSINSKVKLNIFSACGIIIVLIVGHLGLSKVNWVELTGEKKSIKVVQGNINLNDKWNRSKLRSIIDTYLELSKKGNEVDLIVWPEAAMPFSLHQSEFLVKMIDDERLPILSGILERDPSNGDYYNSMAILSGELNEIDTYRKRHLVPFGEFIPLKNLIEPLMSSLEIPMSDMKPGDFSEKPLISFGGMNIGTSICYEDAFSDEIRLATPNADVLVNVSEDAWFGNSFAPHQRLQMAQMRAKENQRYMVRSSNNGLSAIINHQGKILHVAPQFAEYSFDGEVELIQGQTIFSKYGSKLIMMWSVMMLLVALLMSRSRK